MSEGFVVDHGHANTARVSGWVEGAPKKSFWFGVTVQSKPLEISTWRCGGCGYLESYAPSVE